MRTIPNRWNRAWRGDHPATCDICGVRWLRSRLVRKADGLLYCPDDQPGRDAVTCAELNASHQPEGPIDYQDRDGSLDNDSPYVAFGVTRVFDDSFDESFA